MNLHQRPDALTECDREAIHHIAAIQSFGGLIAADAAGRTVHISANLADLLSLPALPATGTPLADILAAPALNAIRSAFAGLAGTDTLERRFGLEDIATPECGECISGEILRGLRKPGECPAFGTRCTPDCPLGAPMVSTEGACSAYYRYRRHGSPVTSGDRR